MAERTDICERLRSGDPDIKKLWRLCWEAAAEIERLKASRAKIDAILGAMAVGHFDRARQLNEEFRAHIAEGDAATKTRESTERGEADT